VGLYAISWPSAPAGTLMDDPSWIYMPFLGLVLLLAFWWMTQLGLHAISWPSASSGILLLLSTCGRLQVAQVCTHSIDDAAGWDSWIPKF
jgi:hypothetical protein